jgi:hypothetical protein
LPFALLSYLLAYILANVGVDELSLRTEGTQLFDKVPASFITTPGDDNDTG